MTTEDFHMPSWWYDPPENRAMELALDKHQDNPEKPCPACGRCVCEEVCGDCDCLGCDCGEGRVKRDAPNGIAPCCIKREKEEDERQAIEDERVRDL